jgi:phosphoglycolate phosphatase-like HAD superfamily hydrolase
MTEAAVAPRGSLAPGRTAFLFDLDGTLVDSVYQHVLAWREAMAAVGIETAVWTIHRRIGMSGGLMANAILRETGHVVTPEEAGRLLRLHAEAYARLAAQIRPLPGARELLAYLSRAGVPWAVATSGWIDSARPTLEALGVPAGVPVVTRDQVVHAKPDPDRRRRAAGGGGQRFRGGGGQRLGPAGRPAGAGAGGGAAVRRLRPGRAGAGRGVPGLPGPGRPAAAPRRGRGPGRGVARSATLGGLPFTKPCPAWSEGHQSPESLATQMLGPSRSLCEGQRGERLESADPSPHGRPPQATGTGGGGRNARPRRVDCPLDA